MIIIGAGVGNYINELFFLHAHSFKVVTI